jgi:hypothetical protein
MHRIALPPGNWQKIQNKANVAAGNTKESLYCLRECVLGGAALTRRRCKSAARFLENKPSALAPGATQTAERTQG